MLYSKETLNKYLWENVPLPDDFAGWSIPIGGSKFIMTYVRTHCCVPKHFTYWFIPVEEAYRTGLVPSICSIVFYANNAPNDLFENEHYWSLRAIYEPGIAERRTTKILPFRFLAALPPGVPSLDDTAFGKFLRIKHKRLHRIREEPGKDTILHAYASKTYCKLPEDFDDWLVLDAEGNTIAHRFVVNNELPASFPYWHETNCCGYTVAHIAAENGTLPLCDLSLLSLRNPADKRTVLHSLLSTSAGIRLFRQGLDENENFKRFVFSPEVMKWEDKLNISIAHLLAKTGLLCECPPEVLPEVMSLRDYANRTTAHYLACCTKNYPVDNIFENFNDWGWQDDSCISVIEAYFMNYKRVPRNFTQWDAPCSGGQKAGHIAAIMRLLPKDFRFWDIPDAWGNTVAHIYAMRRRMPMTFKDWWLKDANGITVAEIAWAHHGLPKRALKAKNKSGQTIKELVVAKHLKNVL